MIYLASSSQRRSDLLILGGISFEILHVRSKIRHPDSKPDVEEIRHGHETAAQYVVRISHEKAHVAWQAIKRRGLVVHPVLAADTEVILHDEVFGKPNDAAHACEMLEKLSGQTHEVRTAVCLVTSQETLHTVSVSYVTMATLRAEQIRQYVASGESFGKAGGYGLQGRAALLVARVEGSPSGIVGLPLYETAQLLERAGYRPWSDA